MAILLLLLLTLTAAELQTYQRPGAAQQEPTSGYLRNQNTGCKRDPSPLPMEGAPYQDPEPADRACAYSCLQLRDQGGSPQDGVYWFTGMRVPVMCDFSHDGGGWTLLLTAVSKDGWDLLSVMGRNMRSPSLGDNYSILRYADAVRDYGSGRNCGRSQDCMRFAYRIEAQAQTGRRRWGGIWWAPRNYSFVDETGEQTNVRLVRRFDKWAYKDHGIEQRMPWLRADGVDVTVLTTTKKIGGHVWGTLVSHENHHRYKHSPWIHRDATDSGTVLYWMREEAL